MAPTCGGRRLPQGTEEFAAFWASRSFEMPTIRMFNAERDDVLVEAEYRGDDGGRKTVWLLYRFEGDRLIEAIGFSSEAQARSYVPPTMLDARASTVS